MKVMKVLFVILLLITVAELGYYLYFQSKSLPFNFLSLKQAEDFKSSTNTDNANQIICNTIPTRIPGVVDKDICNKITNFEAHKDQKMKMVIETRGIVKNVQHNYKGRNNTTIDLRFSVFNSDGLELQTYGFNEKDINTYLALYKIDSSGGKTSAKLSDIVDGTKIQLRLEEDTKVAPETKPENSKMEILIGGI